MQTYQKAVELRRLLQQGQEYPVELLDEIINDIEKLEYETKQEVEVTRGESEFKAIFGQSFFPKQ